MAIRELDDLCMGCMSVNKTGSICPYCGFDNNAPQNAIALPYRTILNKKFLIGRVLGKGGFGITYLAWDLVLQTAVAIKEYLPSTLVARDGKRPFVVAHSDESQVEFEYGLKQFLQEARTLAQFSHANVVRVREFFPANKTAYLVMDYYEGVSLQQFLQLKNQKLSEVETLKIMLPVLNGLAQVHQKGFLHRDIKPDNIYLVDKEHPVLLDFGAARSAINQKSQSLSVILTPGFAPFEQYLSHSHFTPSTDIYSVAATIYYMVSGIKPHEATMRLKNDPMIHLASLEPDLSSQFSSSVMKALAVYPENRQQSIEEFQQQLTERSAQTITFKKTAYNPGAINLPPPLPPEAEPLTLGLAPLDEPLPLPEGKKYGTFYCPHCKAKNIIREGKPLAEAKCIKCRKSPGEKVKEPLSFSLLVKISLAIPLLLIVYRLITHNVLDDPALNHMMAPLVSDPSSSPSVRVHPFSEGIKETAKPSLEQLRQAQQQERQVPTARQFLPRLPPPSADEGGMPRFAPQFAIEACEDKAFHDNCVANTPRRKLPGVCEEVRGVLACIPGIPN